MYFVEFAFDYLLSFSLFRIDGLLRFRVSLVHTTNGPKPSLVGEHVESVSVNINDSISNLEQLVFIHGAIIVLATVDNTLVLLIVSLAHTFVMIYSASLFSLIIFEHSAFYVIFNLAIISNKLFPLFVPEVRIEFLEDVHLITICELKVVIFRL